MLYFFLGVSLLGILTSTIFLVLVLLGCIRFRLDARRQRRQASGNQPLPPVSLLKPIHGIEARLRENFASFFQQDYPEYEILFAADEASDPALDIAKDVCAAFPSVKSRILITGVPPWPNPPVYSFERMAEAADHPILVTSDSDVEVSSSYLKDVVQPLLDRSVGMVTCVYRGKNAAGFWSALTAIGMSVEMTAGVLVANLLEGMKFGLGPTIALRKDSLAAIGGFAGIKDYIANDFELGNHIAQAGYKVVLSRHVIDHIVYHPTFHSMWQNQLRWAQSTRYSRPKGHFGTGLIFAIPYGILGFIAAILLGHTRLGIALLLITLANRLIEAFAVGWLVVRDSKVLSAPWLFPLRDLLGFVVWFASYLNLRYVWRNRRYEFAGTRIVLRQTSSDTH